MTEKYFVTVDWCNKGKRGIFCDNDGNAFPKNEEPHTQEEMYNILGIFAIILNPKSELFNEEKLAKYSYYYPLAEYSHQYGIACIT